MYSLFLWITFRLTTSIIAAYASALRPLTTLEQSISLLPPSLPLSSWLERVTLSPWLRWDAHWYLRIVEHGYTAADGTAQFHPLYPWLAKIAAATGIHPLFSLLLVGSIAGLGFLAVFHRLAQLDLSIADARFSLLGMALAPTAFILFAPYAEGLFLLCAAGAFFLARKQRWWPASMAAGLASLTRQQGLFLLLPLAFLLWENYGRSWGQLRQNWGKFLSLITIPASYAAWIVYRSIALGDNPVVSGNWQSLIYSFFISPSAVEVVPEQSFIWPWKAMGIALYKLAAEPDLDIWVNIILAIIFLSLLIFSWRTMKPEYRIYSVIIFLVSFSYYTGRVHPYMGLPRHLLLAFPVFIFISPRLNRAIIRPVYLSLMGIIYFFLIYLYVLEAWVA